MAIRQIRLREDEILYKRCKEVTKFDEKQSSNRCVWTEGGSGGSREIGGIFSEIGSSIAS